MIALTASIYYPPPDKFIIPCAASELNWDSFHNSPNVGVIEAYHRLWQRHQEQNVLIYMHDDVSIYAANWLERVCLELMTPGTAIVGLGGALGIGAWDLYKVPYRIQNLARLSYRSNQRDWKTHGERETGERQVAVVDGFFMAFRGEFLKDVGGWRWIRSNFHCYDLAMCLEARRRGWDVRMVGVDCEHHGGGTSTKQDYADFCKERGITLEEDHAAPHVWLYNEYRDILPLRI